MAIYLEPGGPAVCQVVIPQTNFTERRKGELLRNPSMRSSHSGHSRKFACQALCEVHTPSTLSECSQNRQPKCAFSGLGDCPNNLLLPFPSPEKVAARVTRR